MLVVIKIMKKNLIVIFICAVFFSCTEGKNNDCANINIVNNNIEQRIEDLNYSIQLFSGESNIREKNIEQRRLNIEREFTNLKNDIFNNKSSLNKIKSEIYKIIDSNQGYMEALPSSNKSQQDSAFNVVHNDFDQILINNGNECEELTMYRINLLEEKLLLKIYTDSKRERYHHNKVFMMTNKVNELKDTSLYLVNPLFYDSTSPPEITYWINDSTKEGNGIYQNWLQIPVAKNDLIYGEYSIKEDGEIHIYPFRIEN